MTHKNYRLSLFSQLNVVDRCEAINHPDGILGLTIPVPVTLEGTEDWSRRVASDVSRRDFVLRDGDRCLGFSGLVSIDSFHGTAELYIFMTPSSYGKGHGTALLRLTLAYAKFELNLRKIILYVTDSNMKAIKLYERAGFGREGTLKKHSWHRGSYVDRHIYSLFLDYLDADPSELYESLQ